MKLGITHNIAAVATDIRSIGGAANRALVSALNSTAQSIKQAEVAEMKSVFDRPTPFTLRSMYIRPAAAKQLTAEIYFKTDFVSGGGGTITEYHYLQPQVYGGGRRIKGLEYNLRAAGLLPHGWNVTPGQFAKLDAYGNISRGQITQILSQLRITVTAGYTRNLPVPVRGNERKVIAALRRAGGRYFAIGVGTGKGLAPGVYLRDFGGGFKGGDRSPMPVLKFVRASQYRKRFPFYEVAERSADQHLQQDFESALRVALAGSK